MKLFAFASAISLGGASLVLACSGTTDLTFDDTDAGSSSGTTGKLPGSSGSSGESSGSSGTSGSSGKDAGKDTGTSTSSSGGAIVDTKLTAGATQIIGVTTGATPHVVYYKTNAGMGFDVEAVPLAGGAAVVLKTDIADDDFAFVNGGAVAWFTGTEAGTKGVGKATAINIWTKANGIKTVTTATRSGLFAATDDGASVAFGTGSTDTTTDLVYTTSAAPVVTTASFTGANAFNWASAKAVAPATAATCAPRVRFAGTVLIAAYCTGTTGTAVAARLGTVAAAAGTVTVRIDNATPANAIQPAFVADAAGDKIFVLGPSPANVGKVVVAAATTTVGTLEAGITGVNVAKDGSQVVYTAGGALKKATFAATPVVTSLVATGALGILASSSDSKYSLYNTLADANDDTLTDAKLVDVTVAAPVPVTILAAATATAYSFTAGAVVFTDAVDPDTGLGKVKSVALTGGAAKVLDPAAFGAFTAELGNGVLTVEDLGAQQGDPWTVKYVDAVLAGALVPVSTTLNSSDNFQWSGKTFVYSDVGATAPGVHAATAP